MSIKAVIDDIKLTYKKGNWNLTESAVKERDPYIRHYVRSQLMQSILFEESLDEVIERMKLVEAKMRNYKKAQRLASVSIKAFSQVDFDKMSSRLYTRVRKLFRKYWEEVIGKLKNPNWLVQKKIDMREARSPESLIWANEVMSDIFNALPDELSAVLSDELYDVYMDSASNVISGLEMVFNKEMFDNFAKNYIQKNFYARGTFIEMTSGVRERIGKYLADSFEEGLDINQIEKYLRVELPSLEDWAIERIARTETGQAASAGALEGARQSGEDLVALFNISPEACEDCQAIAADNPYELSDAEVGELAHINCRDAWSFVARDDYEEIIG